MATGVGRGRICLASFNRERFKMADRRLVVSNVLCFSLRKYGKYPTKTFKSIDFYDVDTIWSAKQQGRSA